MDSLALTRAAHARHSRRAICALYTYPTTAATVPVYQDVTLTWTPACVPSFAGSSSVNLYLSVVGPSGLTPVHEWQGLAWSAGSLTTQLKPTWWNASSGAGSVSAQLVFTPAGAPIWDTAAPSSAAFIIAYNGSYPSVTSSAVQPVYTGPSVESSDTPSTALSSNKLGAAIAVPVLLLLGALVGYVLWTRKRKQPEKKRWSAAIDQRMSMMSEGTWQPPRPSMSSSHRPNSVHPSIRVQQPAAALQRHSMNGNNANRNSQFYGANRPASSYSTSQQARLPPPSPQFSGGQDMAQVGSGDRISRVSFAGGERPLTLVNGKPRSSIYGARNSTVGRPSNIARNSYAGSQTSGTEATATVSPTAINRSGTTEELSNEAFVAFVAQSTSPTMTRISSRPGNHAYNKSTSSLRQEVGQPQISPTRSRTHSNASHSNPNSPRLPSPALSGHRNVEDYMHAGANQEILSPFADPSDLAKPAPVVMMSSHMPMAARDSLIMSPDQALRSYAVKRDAAAAAAGTAPATLLAVPEAATTSGNRGRKGSLVASASAFLSAPKLARSASSLLNAPKRMMKSLYSNDSLAQPASPTSPTFDHAAGASALGYEHELKESTSGDSASSLDEKDVAFASSPAARAISPTPSMIQRVKAPSAPVDDAAAVPRMPSDFSLLDHYSQE